jgi:LysR family transcriptional regulator of gallate degradation
MTPKLRQLRALLAVAQTGRVAKAAVRLNISQPAVTRAIQSLEIEIGVTLFDRTRERMVPTRLGAVIVDRAERAFDHLISVEQELARLTRSTGHESTAQQLSRFVSNHELNAVIMIGDVHSVTSAAVRLGVSQPAVNRSLRNLEQRLGLRLFDRTAQGMIPTAAGEALIRRAKLALVEINQGMEEIANISGHARGRVVIGVLPLSRVYMVPMAVTRLLKDFPEADIVIVDGVYDQLLTDLCDGDIDMIVGTLREPSPIEGIVSESFFEDGMVIAARTGHPIFDNDIITFDHLKGLEWIVPHTGVPLRNQFINLLTENGVTPPKHPIETGSISVARTIAMGSDRLVAVSRSQIHHEEKYGLLKPLSLATNVPKRPIGAVTRSDYVPTPVVIALLDHLREVGKEISDTYE